MSPKNTNKKRRKSKSKHPFINPKTLKKKMVKADNSSSMDNDIQTVLWTADHLSQKVTQLANQITHDFSSSSPPPVIVGVATGAFLFLADLVRNIKLPVTVDFVRAESYGSGTVSTGVPNLSCDLKLDVTGKHVVLVCSFFLFF
jgi:hypoxanthine-guanine phosphoribosyltransferase